MKDIMGMAVKIKEQQLLARMQQQQRMKEEEQKRLDKQAVENKYLHPITSPFRTLENKILKDKAEANRNVVEYIINNIKNSLKEGVKSIPTGSFVNPFEYLKHEIREIVSKSSEELTDWHNAVSSHMKIINIFEYKMKLCNNLNECDIVYEEFQQRHKKDYSELLLKFEKIPINIVEKIKKTLPQEKVEILEQPNILQQDIKEEMKNLTKTEEMGLKNTELKEQNTELKERNTELKERNTELKEQNTELKEEKKELKEEKNYWKNEAQTKDLKATKLEKLLEKLSIAYKIDEKFLDYDKVDNIRLGNENEEPLVLIGEINEN